MICWSEGSKRIEEIPSVITDALVSSSEKIIQHLEHRRHKMKHLLIFKYANPRGLMEVHVSNFAQNLVGVSIRSQMSDLLFRYNVRSYLATEEDSKL